MLQDKTLFQFGHNALFWLGSAFWIDLLKVFYLKNSLSWHNSMIFFIFIDRLDSILNCVTRLHVARQNAISIWTHRYVLRWKCILDRFIESILFEQKEWLIMAQYDILLDIIICEKWMILCFRIISTPTPTTRTQVHYCVTNVSVHVLNILC